MEAPAYAPLPEMTPVPLSELAGLGSERPTFAFDCNGERYVLVGDVLMQYEAPGTQASEDFHTSIARTVVMLDEQAATQKAEAVL